MSQNQNGTSATQLSIVWMGRVGGPLLALVTFLLLPDQVEDPARWTAAVGALMAVFWLTEAMPLPATSLIPLAVLPVLGVVKVKAAAQPYASPIIFLFIGGLMIAAAVQKWGLHRRLALLVLSTVGTKPSRIVAGFMLVSALLSMWISNTATTVMMLPIASSVVGLLGGNGENRRGRNFEICLILGIAYASNIGGIGTLVGTPTNAFLVEQLAKLDLSISFGKWMLMALPLVALMLIAAWVVMTQFVFRLDTKVVSGSQELIRTELQTMGPMSYGQWAVLTICVMAAAMWIAREPLSHWDWFVTHIPWIQHVTDAGIAIAATLALFVIPQSWSTKDTLLDWPTAVGIPWGVLILVGGGLSLSQAVQLSGLNEWLATQVSSMANLSPFLIVLAITTFVVLLTEVASNTATVAILLPILGEMETQAGLPTMSLTVPATMAASCAFMLPVATPPNAIAYGTGRIEMRHMMRAGIWLNLVATGLITVACYFGSAWFLQ